MTAAVRRIALDDGAALRDIRLRSLKTDPSAFGSSFAKEVDRPDTHWRDWSVRASAGPRDSLFLAESGEAPVGLVGAFTPESEPSTRHVVAMWVPPEDRRRGVGTALIGAVTDWAAASGASAVTLWVNDANAPAIELYRRIGFQMTDATQLLPSDPVFTESLMRMELSS